MRKTIFLLVSLSLIGFFISTLLFSLNTYSFSPSENSYVKNDSNQQGDINEYDISYFFGDSIFNYANYNETNGSPTFNGDLTSLQKTNNSYKELVLWQNDLQSEQIIFTKYELLNVKNLRLNIINENADGDSPEVNVDLMQFIRSTKGRGTVYISNGVSYYPDELVPDASIDDMSKFPVQPFLITASTKNLSVAAGEYKYKIEVQYQLNNIYQTKLIPINIKVTNQVLPNDENQKQDVDRFSVDGMTSPTNFYKFGIQQAQQQTTFSAQATTKPDKPEIFNDSEYYFDWMKFNSSDVSYFLRDQYRAMTQNNYSILQWMNLQYTYPALAGNSYIRISATNKGNYASDEDYYRDVMTDTATLLQNENLDWEFDYTSFDEMIKFSTELGINKIYMPVLPRGNDAMKFYYLFNNYQKDNDQFAPVTSMHDAFILDSGSLSDAGEAYLNYFYPKLIQSLTSHLKSKQDDPNFQTADGRKVQMYYVMDETRDSINEKLINITRENDPDGLLKSHAYVGWQFDDSFDEDNDQTIAALLTDKYDEVTLQQREFIVKYLDNSNEEKLQNMIDQRRLNGQVTKIYSSWNNFPAPYIPANPADAQWGIYLSKRLDANGFTRFAFEGYDNQVSVDKNEDETTHEPGDAYLLYPGTGNGEWWSMRIVNMLEAYENTQRLEILGSQHNFDYHEILEGVSQTNDVGRDTAYRWDFNYYNEKEITFDDKYQNVSVQMEKIKNFIRYNGGEE